MECVYIYIFVGKYFSRVTFENNIFRDWKSLTVRKMEKFFRENIST